ncbi:hypothetical protein CDAR_307421 [Caerostris darwini]|uniref:Uncharacterized protein n=1 Tax=Caerostris darwini TaxID=1538125 RepID=A0AAV4T2C0_9ARAC|nr:hypothetical protein CDAR_307421 [Caerostris darwini]
MWNTLQHHHTHIVNYHFAVHKSEAKGKAFAYLQVYELEIKAVSFLVPSAARKRVIKILMNAIVFAKFPVESRYGYREGIRIMPFQCLTPAASRSTWSESIKLLRWNLQLPVYCWCLAKIDICLGIMSHYLKEKLSPNIVFTHFFSFSVLDKICASICTSRSRFAS